MSSPTDAQSRDGTTISFDRAGDGPALILIEPAGHYRELSAFHELVPLLAPCFTVYTYDRRGRGRSGDTPPYTPDREVDDLEALMKAAGGHALVYGYSSGALLAVQAAARGLPIDGLVLLEPPLQEEGATKPDPLTGQLAELIQAGRHSDAVKHFFDTIGVPSAMIAEMRSTADWARMVAIAHTLVYDCMLSDATERSAFRAVGVPTLVLDSAGSTDDLAGWAATVAKLIPNACHKSLPGEWHVVPPALVAAELIRFFGA